MEKPFNTVTTEKEVVDGTEITEAPNNDEIKINVMKDSKVSEDLTGSSETKEPETTGDLKSDNPNNYNQTTVTTEERKANVNVNEVSVSSGIPVYIDENGNKTGDSIDLSPCDYLLDSESDFNFDDLLKEYIEVQTYGED